MQGMIHHFNVEHDGKPYEAFIYLNNKSKFIDEEIRLPDGEELGYEGAEGEIRNAIVNHLSENWDKLVPLN